MRICTAIGCWLLMLALPFMVVAQKPSAGGGNRPIPTGRYYGKIIEDATGKAISYASVQIWGQRFDSTTQAMKNTILNGQLTDDNGEFSIGDIPAIGEHTLKVSYLGYAALEQTVSFGITKGQRIDPNKLDKDVGNLRLKVDSNVLSEVTVTGEATGLALALDKKVFKMDKNAVAAGGTAEDALRNVPSVSVDIDGNLSLRNAAPEVFVDGRPTTLTIDQIPADAIDQIELITNPSAKYDAASGGSSGIINIILKKDRRGGFNGSVRAGIDTNTGGNLGGDLNFREGKINTFISGNYMRRVSRGIGETDRQTLVGSPLLFINQTSAPGNEGYIFSARGGIDWFLNNRNTLTLALNTNRMEFQPFDEVNIRTDSLLATGRVTSHAVRTSRTVRRPQPLGMQLLYKYLFPKEGKELTADINLNTHQFRGSGNYATNFPALGIESRQNQDIRSDVQFFVGQTDFVTPLANGVKLEVGARASVRDYSSSNIISQYNPIENAYVVVPQFANKYQFLDQVYAAYATYQQSFQKFGYQIGLRVESSRYDGKLPDVDSTFSNSYPLSLFPSAYLSYKLNEKDQLLFNYSRKINRPGFFQLLPYTDFTDSLLLSRGNPGLLPEFVNNVELSYQNIFENDNNLLVSLYARYVTDLITRYQFSEFNASLDKNVLVASYTNADYSLAYGIETNYKMQLWKILELNTNLNLYNARVNASNIEGFLTRDQFTWLIKENANIRLPKQWTIQLTGEYQSRAAFINNSGGGGGPFSFGGGGRGGGGGGGPFGNDLNSTAQGYTLPFWSVDVAIRKDIWNKTATITLSTQDIFRSRRRGSHAESVVFIQDGWRIRDPQLTKLNFTWRFGKSDASLFKRKNNKASNEGMDMM